jgi:large conductance mechanosensitive channel
MLKEFKKFVMRGNVVDMAVGIIIGAAFGAIVKSLVNDIIMPPIGVLIGGVDFSKLQIVLKRGADGSVAAAIKYGNFINILIEFVIIAFSIFLIVKLINNFMSKEEAPKAPAAPPEDVVLLREIRDLLKK